MVYSAPLSILMSQRHQNVSFAGAIRLGLKLSGYVIKEIDVATDTACFFACNNEVNCLSYNSEIASGQTGRFRCQLTDSDRFAGFDNFTVDIDCKHTGIQVTNIALLNLRSGPILAVLMHIYILSYVVALKLGLMQSLTPLCLVWPDLTVALIGC